MNLINVNYNFTDLDILWACRYAEDDVLAEYCIGYAMDLFSSIHNLPSKKVPADLEDLRTWFIDYHEDQIFQAVKAALNEVAEGKRTVLGVSAERASRSKKFEGAILRRVVARMNAVN